MKKIIVTASLVVLLAACGGGDDGATAPEGQMKGDASISGSVTYRARTAMPPKARAEVTLQNISTQDQASLIIGRQEIDDPKGVPIAFDVVYDAGNINEADTYAMKAIIFRGDDVWMTNRDTVTVITKGQPASGVQVIVEPIR